MTQIISHACVLLVGIAVGAAAIRLGFDRWVLSRFR